LFLSDRLTLSCSLLAKGEHSVMGFKKGNQQRTNSQTDLLRHINVFRDFPPLSGVQNTTKRASEIMKYAIPVVCINK